MPPDGVFGTFPVLETPNLILREIVSEDAEALFAVFSDAEVTRHYDLDTFDRVEQASDLIARFTRRYQGQVGVRWGIARRECPGGLIGSCGFNIWIQPSRRALLGYDLARSWWRQGIMTEALTAVIQFGFHRMGLNRIEATVFEDNTASHRLMEKLGFVSEGVLRDYEFLKGEYVDMRMYSLLRREAHRT